MLTVPKTIASGENITVPAGRVAVLPNVQVDGTLNVQGDVFIPSGATLSKVVELEGNQTISDVKTFTSSPIVPTPTTGTQAVNLATANSYDLGVGQTWQDVAPSRTNGITYTNSTGKPIQLSISGFFSNGGYAFYINGITQEAINSGTQYWTFKINQIIPNGSTYSLSLSGTESYRYWFELR